MAMGTFTSDKVLIGNPIYISAIADKICLEFSLQGYEVEKKNVGKDAFDISLTKGGIFKSVLGLKTALKVNLAPRDGNIYIKAGVGIFGQQAIPTAVMLLFAWPVLLTQIWGMVQQAKLDDQAIEIAESELKLLTAAQDLSDYSRRSADAGATEAAGSFCPGCGAKMDAGAKFCSECGAKM